MEIWKPVTKAPFSSYYEVSSLGRVRRLAKQDPTHKFKRIVQERILANVPVRGYLHVLLQCEGAKWMTRVHILVALAFIGEPDGQIGVTGYTVNHKDFDRFNNRVENLEWMTAKENHAHAVAHGRKSRGERHYKAILTADIVRGMRSMRANGAKVKDIAIRFGVKEHAASDVLLGRSWAHVT